MHTEPPDIRPGSYSPSRRTALVLCGTGAHGAYHAGVLRALQEAGVKIDIVGGQGVGAASAALSAIDGGARLWDANGIWRDARTRSLYGWRPLLRVAGWLAFVLVLVLLIPLFVLGVGLIVYPVGFLLTLVGLDSGAAVIANYSQLLQSAFSSQSLPTMVPRLAMALVACLLLVLFAGVMIGQARSPLKRRAQGGWWWRLLGAPLDVGAARLAFVDAIWQLIRGAASTPLPSPSAVGRRYTEVLAENLGQPGFRELLLVATDLDTRRDVVAAFIAEPFRHGFFAPQPGQDRRAEVLDLAGVGREHAVDMMSAALTPPLACEPALLRFGTGGFWRGETHRLCDRPASCNRVIEEMAVAGATQVIVVSGVARPGAPHQLSAPNLELRSRLGDVLAAEEAASLRDALEMARLHFDAVYVICPSHNPVGPFDFRGAYDAASDRRADLGELMERAYEDAYRQFIEPVVGASGEQLVEGGVRPPLHHEPEQL